MIYLFEIKLLYNYILRFMVSHFNYKVINNFSKNVDESKIYKFEITKLLKTNNVMQWRFFMYNFHTWIFNISIKVKPYLLSYLIDHPVLYYKNEERLSKIRNKHVVHQISFC